MKQIGFARTAINDTDLNAQIEALRTYGCDLIFHEAFDQQQTSAATKDLDSVITRLEKGDVLVVTHLYRLGKSTRQLTELTELFQSHQIHLVSLTEQIDTRKPMGTIYFDLMESLAKMERILIKERTLMGLNEARKKGKVGGRPKINPKIVKKIRTLYYEKKETIQYISTKCGVSVGTCYKYINLAEEDVKKIYG